MSIRVLQKISAVAAIVGGGLRVIAPLFYGGPYDVAAEIFYLLIDVLLLVGLVGIYLTLAEGLGLIGFLFFSIAFITLASIVGPDPVRQGVNFYLVGATLLSGSLAGLSLVMLRVRILMRAAYFWLGSFGVGLFAMLASSNQGFTAAGILLGLGFTAAGVDTLLGVPLRRYDSRTAFALKG